MDNKQLTNEHIEKWGMFELTLSGPSYGNPFIGVKLEAIFTAENMEYKVNGFYDGNGVYRIRFMPEKIGKWEYSTYSDINELNGIKGSFICVQPSANNHGPVSVKNTYHFCYNDGSDYYPIGTTSYGWAHQADDLASETLKSLQNSPFNKIRLCVLPHYSKYSAASLSEYPFEGEPLKEWDFSRPNPKYFQMIENRIKALRELGIEADLILFHPYNKEWGFESMTKEVDELYLRYIISRFAAFRNVWWSMANEFDLLKSKSMDDWDNICRVVAQNDPYRHLLSIHNGLVFYDHTKPWITHASVQDGLAVTEKGRAQVLLTVYNKPVVYDEVCYEGNFNVRWGDLSGEEMTHRFWLGTVGGTYVGHGEVIAPEGESGDMVWTGIGGQLRGKSIERIAFLKSIIEDGAAGGLEPIDKWWYTNIAGVPDEVYFVYFGKEKPEEWVFEFPERGTTLPEGTAFKVDIIDTWNMEITEVPEKFILSRHRKYVYCDRDDKKITLPGKPYILLRLRKV